MDYILVGIATLLLAFEFACSKKYQINEGTDISSGLKFNALSGLLTVLVFFCLSGKELAEGFTVTLPKRSAVLWFYKKLL
jgi:hypothetical protein